MKSILLVLLAITNCIFATNQKPILPAKALPAPRFMPYIKIGSGLPVQSDGYAWNAVNIGVGSRLINSTHGIDVGSSYFVHPSYSIIGAEISYLFSPECFYGIYLGAGVRTGTFINEFVFELNSDPFETYSYNNTGVILQFPVILGYSFKSNGLRNNYQFIQVQFSHDKFLTFSSGFGF